MEMKNPPNVILVVMDTARADHLSCYGYSRKTTPNIDRIARDGVLYENAFTAAPWTPPSHASIFTGKYPSHHKTIGRDVRFKEGHTSLAEILSRNGYCSIGIVCCEILGLRSGFERGFHKYVDVTSSSMLPGRHTKELIRTLIYGPDNGACQATELAKKFFNREKKPIFLFMNYFNSHTPYDPPRPFKKRFCNDFDEPMIYAKEFLLKKLISRTAEKISRQYLDIKRLQWIASGGGGFTFAAKKTTISEAEWEIVRSWYDGEIAYLDYMFGNLIDFLRQKGILDNTLIIITSDHGENFGEHGLAVHPLCVYDSLLRVPLIISHADMVPKGRRILNLASTIDILPTLTDLLNIEFDEAIQGKSLHPFEDREVHQYICAEYGGLHTRGFQGMQAWRIDSKIREALEQVDRGCKCVRTLTHKYILSLEKEELYDIRDDPLEQVNLANKHPEIVKSLKRKLEKTVDTSYFGPKEFPHADETDKEMIKRLRALGYI